MFSRLVRARADWACVRCGKRFRWGDSALHCSHFHSRRLKSVRFDPENAEAMCAACHRYLDNNPWIYADWKRKQLGEERFVALRLRSQKIVKLDLPAIKAAIESLAQGWGAYLF